MRDIERRAYENQKFLQEREKNETQDYLNGNEIYKQDYWDRKICSSWWHSENNDFPINLVEYRKNIISLEDNFDIFIPGIIFALEDLGFTGDIEDIFILDEQAKNFLINLSKKYIESNKNKTSTIKGINQNNEELSENIGNLFYDSLASFLSGLGDEFINNSKKARISGDKKYSEKLKEIGEYLKLSANHIMKAWEICLPFISKDFPVMKHSSDIKGINIPKRELIIGIGNLTDDSLRDFLFCLSNKINTDGIADEGRGRKKLATELFETSKLLENASKLLN